MHLAAAAAGQSALSLSFLPSLTLLRSLLLLRGSRHAHAAARRLSANTRKTLAPLAMSTSKYPSAREPPAEQTPNVTRKVKLGLCQLAVTADKEANIANARRAIADAADNGANIVMLPEMWNCPYANTSFPVYAESLDNSPSVDMLAKCAKEHSVVIVGGSVPERDGDALYNTCCVLDSSGRLVGKHRKVHLFDIDIPGKMVFKESDTLHAGNAPTVADTEYGRIGVGICYDLRFPELAMLSAARGAQLMCYPGAFNMTTGPLHWELLQKARAVDNQFFVATCSPARDEKASYIAWGHSTAVGPFGEILATTEHEATTIYAELDFSQIIERRRMLPLEQQRRGDVYKLVDMTRAQSPAVKESQAAVV
eukprot:jgi/Chlat1/606/Chrsp103S00952